LNTEYLLYDGISTLGNVGGTLGLFVGFSFTGSISFILNFIISRINQNQIHDQNQIVQVKGKTEDELQKLKEELSKELENSLVLKIEALEDNLKKSLKTSTIENSKLEVISCTGCLNTN